MEVNQQIYSHHTFLFPFKWEVFKGKKHNAFSLGERTILDNFLKKVDLMYWDEILFEPQIQNGFNSYNEYSYFYDHPRDVLNLNAQSQNINSREFDYKGLTHDSKYIITFQQKEYALYFEKVILNIYENGIGVLTFMLANKTFSSQNDILIINDIGRRIYPQYLGTEFPLTNVTKGNLLAESITIVGLNTSLGQFVQENFEYYDNLSAIQTSVFKIPNHIQAFLGIEIYSYSDSVSVGQIRISPLIDDRMFVICLCYDNFFINELSEEQAESKDRKYFKSKKWYQFVFVDGNGLTCHSDSMLENHVRDATYDRWLGNVENNMPSRLLFGITRYSFMGLANSVWFTQNIISKHFQHQYFRLVLLSLVQRASIINFSLEVARISHQITDRAFSYHKERKAIAQLYLRYIKFVNRVFFREVTPQEQGIELYDLLHKQMRLREEVKDLKEEIQELNSYSESLNQGQLTLIAGRFAFPTLFMTLIGIDAVKDSLDLDVWPIVGITMFLFFISDFLIKWTSFKK